MSYSSIVSLSGSIPKSLVRAFNNLYQPKPSNRRHLRDIFPEVVKKETNSNSRPGTPNELDVIELTDTSHSSTVRQQETNLHSNTFASSESKTNGRELVTKETAKSLDPDQWINANARIIDVMNHMVKDNQNGNPTAIHKMAQKLGIQSRLIPDLLASMKEENLIRTFQGPSSRLRRWVDGTLSFKPLYELTTWGRTLLSSRQA